MSDKKKLMMEIDRIFPGMELSMEAKILVAVAASANHAAGVSRDEFLDRAAASYDEQLALAAKARS